MERKRFRYYRLQYWCGGIDGWRDIRKRFSNPIKAQIWGEDTGLICRVIVVWRDGKVIYEE